MNPESFTYSNSVWVPVGKKKKKYSDKEKSEISSSGSDNNMALHKWHLFRHHSSLKYIWRIITEGKMYVEFSERGSVCLRQQNTRHPSTAAAAALLTLKTSCSLLLSLCPLFCGMKGREARSRVWPVITALSYRVEEFKLVVLLAGRAGPLSSPGTVCLWSRGELIPQPGTVPLLSDLGCWGAAVHLPQPWLVLLIWHKSLLLFCWFLAGADKASQFNHK